MKVSRTVVLSIETWYHINEYAKRRGLTINAAIEEIVFNYLQGRREEFHVSSVKASTVSPSSIPQPKKKRSPSEPTMKQMDYYKDLLYEYCSLVEKVSDEVLAEMKDAGINVDIIETDKKEMSKAIEWLQNRIKEKAPPTEKQMQLIDKLIDEICLKEKVSYSDLRQQIVEETAIDPENVQSKIDASDLIEYLQERVKKKKS